MKALPGYQEYASVTSSACNSDYAHYARLPAYSIAVLGVSETGRTSIMKTICELVAELLHPAVGPFE